jgi:hypothetical protein
LASRGKNKKDIKGLIVDDDIIIQYTLNSLSECSCSNCPLRGFCPLSKVKKP